MTPHPFCLDPACPEHGVEASNALVNEFHRLASMRESGRLPTRPGVEGNPDAGNSAGSGAIQTFGRQQFAARGVDA